jgi:xylulokinase
MQVCRAFETSREQLTTLAAREPPGCEGVNFLPYLNGERCPNWPHARASILGLSPG